MLISISALKGHAVETSDDRTIGTIDDILFDDRTWTTKWLVVEIGSWMKARKVLIHPSSIQTTDHAGKALRVKLTATELKASLSSRLDEPVAVRMERGFIDHYDGDRISGSSCRGLGTFGVPLSVPGYLAGGAGDVLHNQSSRDDGDPHLRSFARFTEYHMHAIDGVVGHVENFLVDDETWVIRHIIVDTRDWWPGPHVLMSPSAVRTISWPDGEIRLDISRASVKTSPPFHSIDMTRQIR